MKFKGQLERTFSYQNENCFGNRELKFRKLARRAKKQVHELLLICSAELARDGEDHKIASSAIWLVGG